MNVSLANQEQNQVRVCIMHGKMPPQFSKWDYRLSVYQIEKFCFKAARKISLTLLEVAQTHVQKDCMLGHPLSQSFLDKLANYSTLTCKSLLFQYPTGIILQNLIGQVNSGLRQCTFLAYK